MNITEASIVTPEAKIAVVISRFNYFINNNLLNGAIDTFIRIGKIKTKNIDIIWVPGAYELPLIVKILAKKKKYNAITAIGTIIKGNSFHFELIAKECSSKLSSISIETLIPITFGILTTNNIEQAIERAGAKNGNKGTEAALAALEMINIIEIIKNNK